MTRAFTLIEILIIISIALIILALTIPMGVKFFQSQNLDETVNDILETLRRAQNQALTQKNDSSFGVKFLSDSYILFQGDSFDFRVQSEDEVFDLRSGINISGIDEIVFAKSTGIPNVSGTMTLSSNNETKNININSQGRIERQ